MEMIELETILRYQMETPSGEHGDPADYLLNGRVEIIGRTFDASFEVRLGFLEFTLIRVSLACEDGADLFSIFDQSQEIMDLKETLYDFGFTDFTAGIQKAFPEAFGHEDILLFRDIEVLPFARGQRVGLSALHRVARDLDSGCSLVVIDPRPRHPSNAASEDTDEGNEKLLRHFRGLGFRKIGDAPHLLRSPKLRQIPVAELDARNRVFLPKSMVEETGPDHLTSPP